MDIKNDINYRTERYKVYSVNGDNRYDYARFGVLNKCLPKILFKGNPLLVSFLQIIDTRIIMLLKYVDRLKRFKYISWYN